MTILMTTQLRQRLKASKLSVVLLANYPGAVIKPHEAHEGLRNQGRLEFLFNNNYFAWGLHELGRKLAIYWSNFA